MIIYVLKNINSYEDGEQYFHVSLFRAEKDAQSIMKKEFDSFHDDVVKDEIVVREIDESGAELRDLTHCFTWEIEPVEI